MQGIAAAKNESVLLKKSGTTKNIIDAVLNTVPGVRNQTAGFSRQFSADKAGMKALWQWVKSNIRYEEDELGKQWIREPARLWHDRVGDCKSFTLFIVSVLENLNLKYIIRFVNTEQPTGKRVNHVYPVAILPNGEEVIMDAVYTYWNKEYPYYSGIDYDMTEIYRLSGIQGIGAATEAELNRYQAELDRIAESISDDVLENDLTKMTQGEFKRYMAAEQFQAQAETAATPELATRYIAAASAVQNGGIAGIGNLAPGDAQRIQAFLADTDLQNGRAFSAPIIAIPDNVSGIGSLKDVVNKVVDTVKNVWKKIINHLFKVAMPIAAPFFLFAFVKKKLGRRTEKKRQAQLGLVNWIQKAGSFDSADAVMQSARTGIIKKLGQTPEAILNGSAKGVAGIGLLPLIPLIAKALPAIIDIIGKIVSLFKKKAPAVSASDGPDLNELAADVQEMNAQGITNPTNPTPGGGGGGPDQKTMLLLAAAGAAAFFFLRK